MSPWREYGYGSRIGVAAVSFLLGVALQQACHHLQRLLAKHKQEDAVQQVKDTTHIVLNESQHVSLSHAAIKKSCRDIDVATMASILAPVAFDCSLHFVDGTIHTMEYDSLSLGLKHYIEKFGHQAISAHALLTISVPNIRQIFGDAPVVPLEEERARLLREVGQVLLTKYSGQVSNLIRRANRSAVQLVNLMVDSFPGFRDHAIYKGRQVFFYKRAQIFVADVYGAFQGRGFGNFYDINALTMFADYRVPVVLCKLGVLQMSSNLASKIQRHELLPPGSEEECELRAASIQAVNMMVKQLKASREGEPCPNAVQLDWWLWTTGESSRASDAPHHRTMTIYY